MHASTARSNRRLLVTATTSAHSRDWPSAEAPQQDCWLEQLAPAAEPAAPAVQEDLPQNVEVTVQRNDTLEAGPRYQPDDGLAFERAGENFPGSAFYYLDAAVSSGVFPTGDQWRAA